MPAHGVSDSGLVALAVCLSVVGMGGGAGAVLFGGWEAGWHLFLVSFAAWLGAFVLGFRLLWDRGAFDR